MTDLQEEFDAFKAETTERLDKIELIALEGLSGVYNLLEKEPSAEVMPVMAELVLRGFLNINPFSGSSLGSGFTREDKERIIKKILSQHLGLQYTYNYQLKKQGYI